MMELKAIERVQCNLNGKDDQYYFRPSVQTIRLCLQHATISAACKQFWKCDFIYLWLSVSNVLGSEILFIYLFQIIILWYTCAS